MDAPATGLTLLQCYSDSDTESNHGDTEIIPVESSKPLNGLENSPPKSCIENTTVTQNSAPIYDLQPIETSSHLPAGTSATADNIDKLECNQEPAETALKVSDTTKDPSSELFQENITEIQDATLRDMRSIQTSNMAPANSSLQTGIDDTSFVNIPNSTELTPATVQFSEPYRQTYSSESDSDSSSDESIASVPSRCVVEDLAENDDHETNNSTGKMKMLEDLGLLDLPPLEDLVISVPETECIPIGAVSNIIDLLVLVTAKRGTPAVDLNSVLFLDNGKKTLGKVFDVFGQVNEPIYMVRFNSAEHISEKGIQVGMEVFFAPRTPHTAFVFIDALMKMKGSDASWEHDQEPPEGCIEYSDDEEERKAKAAQRMRRTTTKHGEEESSQLPRPKKQRQGSQFYRRNANSPANPFYMQPNQQYYPPHPSHADMWTNRTQVYRPAPQWGPPPNQVPPNQAPPNQVPPNQVPPNQLPLNQAPPNQLPPNQLYPSQLPPNHPPPPYMYPPFGGPPQFPPS